MLCPRASTGAHARSFRITASHAGEYYRPREVYTDNSLSKYSSRCSPADRPLGSLSTDLPVRVKTAGNVLYNKSSREAILHHFKIGADR